MTGSTITSVEHTTAADGAPIWTLTDSTDRTTTVTFKRLPNPGGAAPDALNYDVVKSIAMPAYTGTAVYTLHYRPDDQNNDQLTLISRQWTPQDDPALGNTVWVPLLTGIDLPDGRSWRIEKHGQTLGYDIGDATNLSRASENSFTGNITSIRLPTRGLIEWDWQEYRYPQEEAASEYHPYVRAIGLRERRLVTAAGTCAASCGRRSRVRGAC